MKSIKYLLLPLFLMLFMSSCESDDSNSPQLDNSNLFDKWWYDSDNFTADLYFHSNGDFEQVADLLGQTINGQGTWSWLNEQEGLMSIEYTSGNVAQSVTFKFTNIQENSFTLSQSLDGETFSIEVFYIDTDN